MADHQPLTCTQGAEPQDRQRHRPYHRCHGVGRRSDHEGQALVLRVRPLFFCEQLHCRHAVQGREPRRGRPVHPQRAGAPDVADLVEVEAGRLSRRNRQVPRPRHAEQVRARDGGNPLVLAGLPYEPGEADRDAQPAPARRRRFLEQPRVLHEQLPGRDRTAARHRRVVCHDRTTGVGPRRSPSRDACPDHPEPGAVQLAGGSVLRHGCPQPEDRRPVPARQVLSHR